MVRKHGIIAYGRCHGGRSGVPGSVIVDITISCENRTFSAMSMRVETLIPLV